MLIKELQQKVSMLEESLQVKERDLAEVHQQLHRAYERLNEKDEELEMAKVEYGPSKRKIRILEGRLKSRDTEWRSHISEFESEIQKRQVAYREVCQQNLQMTSELKNITEKFAKHLKICVGVCSEGPDVISNIRKRLKNLTDNTLVLDAKKYKQTKRPSSVKGKEKDATGRKDSKANSVLETLLVENGPLK